MQKHLERSSGLCGAGLGDGVRTGFADDVDRGQGSYSHRSIAYLIIHDPLYNQTVFLVSLTFAIKPLCYTIIMSHYLDLVCHSSGGNNNKYVDLYKFPQFEKGLKSNFGSVQVPLADDNKARR